MSIKGRDIYKDYVNSAFPPRVFPLEHRAHGTAARRIICYRVGMRPSAVRPSSFGHIFFLPNTASSALGRQELCVCREMIPFIKDICHPLEKGSFFPSFFFFFPAWEAAGFCIKK